MLGRFCFFRNYVNKVVQAILFSFMIFPLIIAEAGDRTDVYFSHEYRENGQAYSSDMGSMLSNLISTAKHRIFMAIYMITDEKIARAIINAKEKNPNIDIQIVVDETSVEYSGGKAILLAQNGIKVYVFSFEKLRACKEKNSCCKVDKIKHPKKQKHKNWFTRQPLKVGKGLPASKSAIMHNKYVIVDDIFWSGSFNFTNRANFANQENAIVTTNKGVVEKALVNFKNHLRHVNELIPSEVIAASPKNSVKDKSNELRNCTASGKRESRHSRHWYKRKAKAHKDSDFFDEEPSFFAMAKRWYSDLKGAVRRVFT